MTLLHSQVMLRLSHLELASRLVDLNGDLSILELDGVVVLVGQCDLGPNITSFFIFEGRT